jgi:hypothetical protein
MVSFYVDYYMIYKGTGGGIGFFMFGGPIMEPILQWLKIAYPGWRAALNPKK